MIRAWHNQLLMLLKLSQASKKSSDEKVVENNVVRPVRCHRENDGRVRQLCGPKINFVIGRLEFNYVVQQQRWIHK
jgi:hypothetical protein